jgi:sugar lactone lactonase YvrE
MTVAFTVGLNGKVERPTLETGATLRDAPVLRCLLRYFAATQFPSPDQGSIRVTVTLYFSTRFPPSKAVEDAARRGVGASRAQVLASEQNRPSGLAVDATSVYWSNSGGHPAFTRDAGPNGSIMKVSVDGGSVTSLVSGLDSPSAIAVDQANIYWTEWYGSVVKRLPLKGGEPITLASGKGALDNVVVDDTNVYWSDLGRGTVMKMPISGGTPTAFAPAQKPSAIAVDRQNVYWTDLERGTVMKTSIAGGRPAATLASVQGRAHGLAVDATHLYWASGFDTLMKLPLDGGKPVRLALSQYGIDAVAVDSGWVYWANYSAGTVSRLAVHGGAPTILASAQQEPLAIAVQGGNIYGINHAPSSGKGTVMKLHIDATAP